MIFTFFFYQLKPYPSIADHMLQDLRCKFQSMELRAGSLLSLCEMVGVEICLGLGTLCDSL